MHFFQLLRQNGAFSWLPVPIFVELLLSWNMSHVNCCHVPLCHCSQVDKMTTWVKRGEKRIGWGAVTVSGFLQ